MFSETINTAAVLPIMAFKGADTKTRRRLTPADRLRTALVALAEGHGTVTDHGERSWASITFAGTRHQVTLVFTGAAAIEASEKFIAFLPEHDFAIPGQLVADAAVSAVDHQMLPEERMVVQVEVLMLDDN
ncbi:hypothetical protein [Croceibacterium ferulae]|uniref:hypothetical protein n=1 Tax=Croceibacterium ferulae TaxID=1854641 RepID=UPI001F4DC8DF|nr:hypothetical protein [Croceibacterium ferulae]